MRSLAALLCCALVACAPAKNEGAPPDDTQPNPTFVTVRGVIGPLGGVLEHPKGARVVFPPGVFESANPVEATLSEVATPAERLPEGVTPIGPFFRLDTGGFVAHRPIEFSLKTGATAIVGPGALAVAAGLNSGGLGLSIFAAAPGHDGFVTARLLHDTTLGVVVEPSGPATFAPFPVVDLAANAAVSVPLRSSVAGDGASWTLNVGGLPPGLEIQGEALAGTPTTTGRFVVELVAEGPTHRTAGAVFVFDVQAPSPEPLKLTDTTPRFLPTASSIVTITLQGSGFTRGTQARVAGSPVPTTFLDPARLLVTLPPSLVATEHPLELDVHRPDPEATAGPFVAYVSNSGVNPIPLISSVNPDHLVASGGDQPLTVAVRGPVVPGTVVVAGTKALETSVQGSELHVTVPSGLVVGKTLEIKVRAPPPGGGDSEPWRLDVRWPVEKIIDRALLYGLAAGGGYLYLLEDDPPSGGSIRGHILRTPLSAPTAFQRIGTMDLLDPSEIVADDAAVYVLGGCAWNTGNNSTLSIVRTGQATQQFGGHPQGCGNLVQDADAVYWRADSGLDAHALRAPKTGGQGSSIAQSHQLWSDGVNVYYSFAGPGDIFRYTGSTPARAIFLTEPYGLIGFASNRADFTMNTTVMRAFPPADPQPVASLESSANALLAQPDGTFVVAGTKLVWVPLTGPASTLADGISQPVDGKLLRAGGYLWWLGQDQKVYRILLDGE